jgi:hypothetical protein
VPFTRTITFCRPAIAPFPTAEKFPVAGSNVPLTPPAGHGAPPVITIVVPSTV